MNTYIKLNVALNKPRKDAAIMLNQMKNYEQTGNWYKKFRNKRTDLGS